MTPGDALTLTLVSTQLGIPMAGMEVLQALGNGGGNAELAERLAQQRRVLLGSRDAMLTQFDEVEAALQRSGVEIPTRPNVFAEYVTWAASVLTPMMETVRASSAEGGMATLGKAVGDVLQSVAVNIVVLYLLEAAPDNERLATQSQMLSNATKI